MRAFVALEIPDQKVLDSLEALQAELRKTDADLKLVERKNLHFTIKFLGEIPEVQAKEADMRLRSISARGGEVGMEGVGAFPSASHPSIVWAGVAPLDEETVIAIARTAVSALEGIGGSDHRPFRPHLTLARIKSGRNLPRLSEFILTNRSRSFGRVRLASLKLKSSTLTSRGPIYSDIGVYPLA